MPRKYFRKYLPDHASIHGNKYLRVFQPLLKHPNLWHLNRHSVAGGVAAGMFAGLIPGSNPVQFTAAALLAVAGRVNLPVAVLVTLYSNPFTIVPLYYCAFKLGELALFQENGALPPLAFELEGKGFSEWIPAVLHWLATVGKPLAVGLPLLALLLAAVGYFAVDWAWRLYVRCAWQNRRKRRTVKS